METQYSIKGYCAGMCIVEKKEIAKDKLEDVLKALKNKLKDGLLSMKFGKTQVLPVTELCVDVYESQAGRMKYRADLSVAFKKS